MSIPRLAVLLGALAGLGPAGASAADSAAAAAAPPDPWDNPISADRPGATNPASVVDPRVWQLEAAVEFLGQGAPGVPRDRLADFPTMLRFGLVRDLEVRASSSLFSVLSPGGGGPQARGFADVSLGLKWSPWQGGGGPAPDVAMAPTVSLPVGAEAFSAHKLQPGVSGLCSWTLGRTALGLNLGVSRLVRPAAAGYFWQLGGAGGAQLNLTRRWSVSADVFDLAPFQPGQGQAWGVDQAVALLVTPDLQVDAGIAETVGGPQRGFDLQLGLSWRRRPAGPTR
ncbi:MAG TPA: transporter [Candidatus Saccharimonadales bacterium]|nr:transporter [Candidatus Saccharimonadales bacterium]